MDEFHDHNEHDRRTGSDRRGEASVLDESTNVNLKLVVGIVTLTVVIVGSWFSVKHDLADLKLKQTENVADMKDSIRAVLDKVERMEEDRWTKQNDLYFMERFTYENKLTMPKHPAED